LLGKQRNVLRVSVATARSIAACSIGDRFSGGM
jgi:hypothetical protein